MLIGTRIVLRDYVASDAHPIHRWKNDRNTTLWMGPRFQNPSSFEETLASLDRVIHGLNQRSVFFAIADKTTLDYLGGIDLTDIDTDRNAVLSLVIADEANRNLGYATEAIQLLLGHAFDEMGLHRVSLNVYEENAPAFRCYLKNGFRVEGPNRPPIPMRILASEHRTT